MMVYAQGTPALGRKMDVAENAGIAYVGKL